jgi:hypothetical protein
VPGEVADEFPGAERVADEGNVAQAEMVDDGGQIVRERVEVVADAGRSDRPWPRRS